MNSNVIEDEHALLNEYLNLMRPLEKEFKKEYLCEFIGLDISKDGDYGVCTKTLKKVGKPDKYYGESPIHKLIEQGISQCKFCFNFYHIEENHVRIHKTCPWCGSDVNYKAPESSRIDSSLKYSRKYRN